MDFFRIFNGYQRDLQMNQRSRRDFLTSMTALGVPTAIRLTLLGQKKQGEAQSGLQGELSQLLGLIPERWEVIMHSLPQIREHAYEWLGHHFSV